MAEFASKGVAGAGLGLGIAGTALALLQNGDLGGILNGGRDNHKHDRGYDDVALATLIASMNQPREVVSQPCSENTYVNRFELQQEQRIAQLESEKAGLQADIKTDAKILELYKYVDGKFTSTEKEIYATREYTTSKFAEQSVFNEKMIGKVSEIATIVGVQGSRLDAITTEVVPYNKVCNTGCCFNQ